MIRTLSLVAASVLVVGVGAALAQAPLGPDGLPTGPGHDTFVNVCSGCHAPDLVMDKRLSYAGWNEMVETMVGRGAAATPAEVKEITDYLFKNFPDPSAASPGA